MVRAQESLYASGVGCSAIRSRPPVKRPTRAARRIVIVRIAVAAEAGAIDPTGNGIVMAAVANVDEIAANAANAANAVNAVSAVSAANVANAATVRIVTAASAAHAAAIVTVTGIATGTSLPPRRVQPQATPQQRPRRSPKVAHSGRDRRTVHVVRVTRVVAAIASALLP